MARLTDDEIAAICGAEIDAASGYSSGELSQERAEAMDYYLGEPYGDEQEGRSQVRTREVLDTVESIMPQLMRIYADVDNMVVFDAVGPEDESQAQQESDRVNDCFWRDNRGFWNLYSFCKDALLSKTGCLKVWFDDAKRQEREEYRALNDFELAQLLHEDGVEREVLEHELTEEGHHVVFLAKSGAGKVVIEPVTPEEFGINRDARSPYVQDGQFVYHRVRKRYSELVEEGYSRKLLDSLPSNDDTETEERLARRHLSDESDTMRFENHRTMRTIWVTECYVRMDRDDDGLDELLKVTLATGASGSGAGGRLMGIEEVDEIPFFTASPVPITGKFYGLSVADLVKDIQRIRSTLLRSVLDNTYLANNLRTHINENVNLDDMLTRRPGGLVRHKKETSPGANMAPEPYYPLPQHTFPLMEYMDSLRKDRTGVGDEVPGLDAMSLANVNTGVAALAFDQARMRIELIARIFAEVAFRPMFRYIHELLIKHQDKREVARMRGKWVEINPSEWRHRENMTVQVGIGISSRERRLMGIEQIMAKQGEVVQSGGMNVLLGPQHIYQSLHDYTDALGLEPGKYWQDPAELPPQQPEGPSIQEQALMAQAQAQLMAAQAAKDRNQVEVVKAQISERVQAAQAQATMREAEAKRALEGMRGQLDLLKAEAQRESATGKAALEAEVKRHQMQIEAAEMRLKDQQEADKREVELYRALLQSGTQLTQEQMKLSGAENGGAAGLFSDLQAQTGDAIRQVASELAEAMRAELGEVKAQILEDREARKAPRAIKRDKQGLIIAIGDSPVARDESGKVVQIG